MCYLASSEFFILSVNQGVPKHNYTASSNRKGTNNQSPELHAGFFEISQLEHVREGSTGPCSFSNPVNCQNGITISVWARLIDPPSSSNPENAVSLINSGPPEYRGLSIYLTKSTRQHSAVIFWSVQMGMRYWTTHAEVNMSELVGQWKNWALSWSAQQGLFGILDGRIVGIPFIFILITHFEFY